MGSLSDSDQSSVHLSENEDNQHVSISCPLCENDENPKPCRLRTITEVQAHFSLQHWQVHGYACQFCGLMFGTKEELLTSHTECQEFVSWSEKAKEGRPSGDERLSMTHARMYLCCSECGWYDIVQNHDDNIELVGLRAFFMQHHNDGLLPLIVYFAAEPDDELVVRVPVTTTLGGDPLFHPNEQLACTECTAQTPTHYLLDQHLMSHVHDMAYFADFLTKSARIMPPPTQMNAMPRCGWKNRATGEANAVGGAVGGTGAPPAIKDGVYALVSLAEDVTIPKVRLADKRIAEGHMAGVEGYENAVAPKESDMARGVREALMRNYADVEFVKAFNDLTWLRDDVALYFQDWMEDWESVEGRRAGGPPNWVEIDLTAEGYRVPTVDANLKSGHNTDFLSGYLLNDYFFYCCTCDTIVKGKEGGTRHLNARANRACAYVGTQFERDPLRNDMMFSLFSPLQSSRDAALPCPHCPRTGQCSITGLRVHCLAEHGIFVRFEKEKNESMLDEWEKLESKRTDGKRKKRGDRGGKRRGGGGGGTSGGGGTGPDTGGRKRRRTTMGSTNRRYAMGGGALKVEKQEDGVLEFLRSPSVQSPARSVEGDASARSDSPAHTSQPSQSILRKRGRPFGSTNGTGSSLTPQTERKKRRTSEEVEADIIKSVVNKMVNQVSKIYEPKKPRRRPFLTVKKNRPAPRREQALWKVPGVTRTVETKPLLNYAKASSSMASGISTLSTSLSARVRRESDDSITVGGSNHKYVEKDGEEGEPPGKKPVLRQFTPDSEDELCVVAEVENEGCTATAAALMNQREKKFACPKCSGKFITQASLNAHLENDHRQDAGGTTCMEEFGIPLNMALWLCRNCCHAFPSAAKKKEHANMHGHQLACESCSGIAYNHDVMTNHHDRIKEGRIAYICSECEIEYEHETNLHEHNNKVHGTHLFYFCKMCEWGSTDGVIVFQHYMKTCPVGFSAASRKDREQGVITQDKASSNIGVIPAALLHFQVANVPLYKHQLEKEPYNFARPSLCNHRTMIVASERLVTCRICRCFEGFQHHAANESFRLGKKFEIKVKKQWPSTPLQYIREQYRERLAAEQNSSRNYVPQIYSAPTNRMLMQQAQRGSSQSTGGHRLTGGGRVLVTPGHCFVKGQPVTAAPPSKSAYDVVVGQQLRRGAPQSYRGEVSRTMPIQPPFQTSGGRVLVTPGSRHVAPSSNAQSSGIANTQQTNDTRDLQKEWQEARDRFDTRLAAMQVARGRGRGALMQVMGRGRGGGGVIRGAARGGMMGGGTTMAAAASVAAPRMTATRGRGTCSSVSRLQPVPMSMSMSGAADSLRMLSFSPTPPPMPASADINQLLMQYAGAGGGMAMGSNDQSPPSLSPNYGFPQDPFPTSEATSSGRRDEEGGGEGGASTSSAMSGGAVTLASLMNEALMSAGVSTACVPQLADDRDPTPPFLR